MTSTNTSITATSNTETKILRFPENRIVRGRPINTEQFNEDMAEHKIKYIDYILSRNMSMLYTKLGLEGINTETEVFYKDFSFTVETLRSALYRTVELPHPIQEIVDENFECDMESEENSETIET
jgi:hypothetical protein